MGKVFVFDHPLIQHKVSLMRKKETSVKEFRELATEVALLMGFEATRNLPLEEVEIETPICKAKVNMLKGEDLAIIPILRAGLGFVDGMLKLVPNAKVGHIGLYRDPETHKPVEYYCKLPTDIEKRQSFVVDPMLATGGSMELGYKAFLTKGTPKQIHVCCVIASPEGIDHIKKTFPEDKTTIWCAAVDPGMNEHKYIVPGFGDAGDLCYGGKL